MSRQQCSLAVSYLVALILSPNFYGAWSLISLHLTAVRRHENATAVKECPHPERDEAAYHKEPILGWSETVQSLPNGIFQLGKSIGLLTSGHAGRFIKWRILVPLMLICGSLLSFATPFTWSYIPLFSVMRLAAGVFQAYTLCGLYVTMSFGEPEIIRRWNVRGLFATIFAGRALSFYMAGLVLEMKWDVSTTFYLFGCCALVLACLFLITAEGITEIKNTAGLTLLPWLEVLKSEPVNVACLATAGHLWVFVLFMCCLPRFLQECLVLSKLQNGLVMCLILLCVSVVIISHGLLDDYLQYHNHLPDYLGKRIYASLASFVPTFFFILAAETSCNAHTTSYLLVLGGSFLGFFYSCVVQNLQKLSPQYEFHLVCLSFSFGSLIGGCSPLIVSVLASNHFHDEWRKITWVTFLIVNALNTFYMFGSSVKRETWDRLGTVRQQPEK